MSDFAAALIAWQPRHGRHGLPWQGVRDPYRVWLSEIMLQQTQVSTVLGYYERFLQRFARVDQLANASLEDVLALWSGLGYYSRARNLHGCAQQVRDHWGGAFPRSAAQLQTLRGIGPSTAAAIAAFCFDERVSILDGNVKRVLARHAGLTLDVGSSAGVRALQQLASSRLPAKEADMPVYTQALMDLGATVCTPRKPRCPDCPVQADCVARATQQVDDLPRKTRKLSRQTARYWLWFRWREDATVWLERRPDTGVWAGLYAPPMLSDDPFGTGSIATPSVTAASARVEHGPVIKHVLTHRDWYLHPVWESVHDEGANTATQGQEKTGSGGWYGPGDWERLGLPAPVSKLLQARLNPARGDA